MSDEFDDQFAAELIGAHVLVGVTHMDDSGKPISQTQFHGKVTKADPKDGVTIVDAGEKSIGYHRIGFQTLWRSQANIA